MSAFQTTDHTARRRGRNLVALIPEGWTVAAEDFWELGLQGGRRSAIQVLLLRPRRGHFNYVVCTALLRDKLAATPTVEQTGHWVFKPGGARAGGSEPQPENEPGARRAPNLSGPAEPWGLVLTQFRSATL
jgi:hypothetical protein